MAIVNDDKLEAVANFISEMEVEGECVCHNFNEALEENRIDVPCDVGSCEGDCPFYSKENFLNWIKKPTKKLSIREVKRPDVKDFFSSEDDDLESDGILKIKVKESIAERIKRLKRTDSYILALEQYCTDLENLFANLEYDLDTAECENKALLNKLEKIRGVLDGSH